VIVSSDADGQHLSQHQGVHTQLDLSAFSILFMELAFK